MLHDGGEECEGGRNGKKKYEGHIKDLNSHIYKSYLTA